MSTCSFEHAGESPSAEVVPPCQGEMLLATAPPLVSRLWCNCPMMHECVVRKLLVDVILLLMVVVSLRRIKNLAETVWCL